VVEKRGRKEIDMPMKPTLALLACAILLAGCPKKPTTVETPAAPTTTAPSADTSGATTGGTGDIRALPDAAGAAAAGTAAPNTVFYFDFDSADVRPDYQSQLANYGKQLSQSRAARVKLDGHTDERGSPEYNVALGERRAQAIRRTLLLAGAVDEQITTVSLGEERPAVEGGDEDAWSKNRRVELTLTP
jgi:peptidoglycan-associated lipoprotein